jgi:sugar/nucleoside kinase (ribokinase family)
MTKTLIGIGNAAIDGTVEILSDDELSELGLIKGTCVFVDGTDHRMKHLFENHSDYIIDPGGASANALCAYSALGGQSRFIGKTGQDEHGDFFTQNIRKFGVVFDTLPTDKVESTFLFSVITPDRERSFLSNHGASHEISGADVNEQWFTPNTSLIIDGYMAMSGGGPDAMFTAIEHAKSNDSDIIFMPCSLTVIEDKWDIVSQIITDSDAVICNEDEAFGITKTNNVKDIKNYFDWGVVTLGARGAFYFDNKGNEAIIPVPFKPDHIENTNGAGDNFAGGFLYGIHHDMPFEQAVILGQLCAIHVLSKTGARCDFDIRHLLKDKHL